MDGVNARGQRVSLLNDESGASAKAQRLPSRPAIAVPSQSQQRPGPRPLVVHAHAHHPSSPRKPSYSSRSAASSTTSASNSTTSSTILYHSDSDSSLSRHSSIASPRFSPALRAVPHLSRHDSSASAQSCTSPMTPASSYPFEPLDPQAKSAVDPSSNPFAFASLPPSTHSNPGLAASTMSAATNAPYYPSPAQGALPISASQTNMFSGFPNLQQPPFDETYIMPAGQLQYQFATNLIEPLAPVGLGTSSLATPTSLSSAAASAAIPPVDPSSAPSNNNNNNNAAPGSATKAKKKYPCPHAAKFNCHDTFTTSGHAARHGKKHTGEKNILCPTCHKAFTRKDNMKQHERTHKNNRNSDSIDHGKSGAATGNSRRTQSISSVAASTITHKSSNSVDMELDSPMVDAFDSKRSSLQRPNLARPGQFSGSNSTGSAEFKIDPSHRPELNRQFSGESQDGEGESPGLDALAMAATSEYLR